MPRSSTAQSAKRAASGVISTDWRDMHLMITSFCTDRHTFQDIAGRDMPDPEGRDHYRLMLSDMVVDYLTADRGCSRPERNSGAKVRTLELWCALPLTASALVDGDGSSVEWSEPARSLDAA